MNIVQLMLLPFSWLYGLTMILRNWCFEVGVFHVEQVSVPVISVGNMTAGGTGKTPMVEYLIRFYLKAGNKVAVLSRGYQRDTNGTQIVSDGSNLEMTAEESGDEPYQIARKFPNVMVIVDEKRSRAAQIAINRFQPDVILLDDGFQHRGIERQLDIVMIDGRKALDRISLLPVGLRREPLSGLQRANLMAISCDDKYDRRI